MQRKKLFTQSRQVIPEMVTDQGAVRCRFDLFIVLDNKEKSRYPGAKRAWCHRGDKHSSDPDAMLRYLLSLFVNHCHKWRMAELWDNTRAKNDPDRCIIRYANGVIEQNRLKDYADMLLKVRLPHYLR